MAADEVVEVENWIQERVLGSGGFGTVTLWRNKTTTDLIALKKCRTGTDVLLTPKHKERWAKEVEIMKRLNHPNVVKSIEVPSDLAALRSELPLMCMEFCSKGDLRQVLNKSENCCGLQENDVRTLISDVKSAVQYLHLMKITHRDLKPENIVLQETENKIVYKLIDLGYAKELDQSSICTSFVGTLQYLAPELFMSKKYTCSVDYWSLGLVSHEVITGVRPFLPNMSPAAWMTHVKDKSSDHICAYQDLDGSVVFSSELCHQNHISSTLKYHLERWLKLVLEWDPAKRGRAPGRNEIVVFDLIEGILNKKIVTVFCVPAFKYLSYEIDDSTAVTTLQRWIERDTELPVANQELLLPTGQPVDMEKEACQCLASPHNQNGAMLYVYRQGSLKVEHDAPKVPPFVAKMLEEPKGLMEYVHQKRTWAHAVFFLQQELQLFTALLLAYKIKLHNLMINSTKLNQQTHSVISQLHEAEARFSLSNDSLAFDEEYAKKFPNFSVKMTFWKNVNSGMIMKMNKLKVLVKQLETKCGSVHRRTLELQRNSHLNATSYDALMSYAESGLKCYENLRRRPKEVRQRKSNNLEMARIVYHCLKERYIFLKDEPSLAYLNQLLGVQAEIKQLWNPLSKTQKEIYKAIAEIKQAQLERQHSIWTEIASPEQCNGILPVSRGKSPVFTVPSVVTPSIIDPELPFSSSSPGPNHRHMSPEPILSTPVDDSQQQSLVDSICGVPDANVDTSAMINHNKHLRYMTQDLLTESFQQHVKLLAEGTSLDWTFLDAKEDQ